MAKSELIGEIRLYLKERKRYWLLPIIIIVLALGLLISFAEMSVVAPFIYTLF